MPDVTAMVRRMPELESALGISFEGVYAKLDPGGWRGLTLTVNADVVAPGGTIRRNISVTISAYNAAGELVGTGEDTIWEDDFHGIESLSEEFELVDEPVAVFLFPRPT